MNNTFTLNMELSHFTISNNVYVPRRIKTDTSFEDRYIRARFEEQRVYSDDEVRYLPLMYTTHPHYKEWQVRKTSADKLIKYLKRKKQPLKILEIGCGNGWLCNHLSMIPEADVTGVDINLTELQQAGRVFKDRENLRFIYGDARNDILGDEQFDIILFAASIQYFHSLTGIIECCYKNLDNDGEIHILDSPFYTSSAIEGARQRTKDYFSQLGFPEMANHYHHHCLQDIASFNHKVLFDPARSWFNKHPFHWLLIKKKLF